MKGGTNNQAGHPAGHEADHEAGHGAGHEVGGARRALFSHELQPRLDEMLFASHSHRSSKSIADGLEPLRREQQELVLHWVGVAAQSYAEIGYHIATLAPGVLERLDARGFEAWALNALDTLDREGSVAALAALRDLDGFCLNFEPEPCAAQLSESELRLARFLQGLSGRPLALSPGAQAYTDTETVFLPAQLTRLASAEDNRRLYKATAALLWAQTRYGTFGKRGVNVEAALLQYPEQERALRWFAVLEAIRLEAVLSAELPGLAAEIARLRGPWPKSLEAAVARLGRPDADVEDSLDHLDGCMESFLEPPDLPHAGTIDIKNAFATRSSRITRESQVMRKAMSNLKGAGSRRGASQEAKFISQPDGKVELQVDGQKVALPPEAQAAAESLLQDLGELPQESLQAGSADHTLQNIGERDTQHWRPSRHEDDYDFSDEKEPPLVHSQLMRHYDEWDYRRGAYRRGWCHLFEVELPPGEAEYVEKVSQRHAAAIRRIRRHFEMLRGEDRILGRQTEGEDLDLDALVEAAGDRAAGAEPQERLYCRRVRNDRSLATMFMVDMSGSTKGWVNDAERESLVMLCEALERLGDAYAIYGFSGWTRTHCEIYPVKRFDERYTQDVRARIAAIQAKDFTRMGVAIRHLTQLLEAQPARHRLLVTLSDGRPDDHGDEYRGYYGIEDTRRALQEAHSRGVRSYCITIDRHGADYLPHLYGPAHYTVLDDARKLPLKVADIYRRLTT